MAINYKLCKKPANFGQTENDNVYPLAQSERTISKKELIEQMVQGSTLTPVDAEAALSALSTAVAYELSQGYRVELPDFGIFSPSLRLDKNLSDGKYLHGTHLSVGKINFRANKTLLYHCQKYGFNQIKSESVERSMEERWNILSEYLKQNGMINLAQYGRLVNISSRKATADLEEWCRQGQLREQAVGKFRMFLFL